MKRQYLLLSLIILLAVFLRFWQLGQNPPSLTWDEAAWGYNAYSLGIDGRDEFGRFLPLDYLESFGDFKPPVYAYLDVIPVKIFGLNEFAVRFPSAFFGVLTVLITYFLVKRLFQNSKNKDLYALFSSLFLALSPWHIMLSRAAFEANIATFFIVLGIFLFLQAVFRSVVSFPPRRWKPIDTLGVGVWLSLSAVSFVLSMYTFNTARVVVPLLLLALAIGFRKEFFERKKEVIIASLVGLIMIIPLAQFILTPQASLRFKEVNIFSDVGPIQISNQEILNDGNAFWSKIIHNRRFAYGVEYLKHYFDHFNPSFLFIKGDGNPKFSTQEVGQMYLWDLPFLVIGAFLIFRKKEGYWWIVPVWLVLAIIPAATARETPHALRIETALPTFQILVAYGFVNFMSAIKKYRRYVFCLLFSILFLNVLYFLHGYFSHYAKEFSGEWQYGYKESIGYVTAVQDKFDQINITEELGRPYIYYLFYMKRDPQEFRKSAIIERETLGFVKVKGFDKYHFGKDLERIESPRNTLYINTQNKVPANANVLQTFNLLNGNPALVAYTL